MLVLRYEAQMPEKAQTTPTLTGRSWIFERFGSRTRHGPLRKGGQRVKGNAGYGGRPDHRYLSLRGTGGHRQLCVVFENV